MITSWRLSHLTMYSHTQSPTRHNSRYFVVVFPNVLHARAHKFLTMAIVRIASTEAGATNLIPLTFDDDSVSCPILLPPRSYDPFSERCCSRRVDMALQCLPLYGVVHLPATSPCPSPFSFGLVVWGGEFRWFSPNAISERSLLCNCCISRSPD